MGRYTESRMLKSVEKWRKIRLEVEADKDIMPNVAGACGFCDEFHDYKKESCESCPLKTQKICSNHYSDCLFWKIELQNKLSDIKKMERIIIDVAEKVLSGCYDS